MTRLKKSLFLSLSSLIGSLLLIGAFLPTFLSSGLGKKCIIHLVESSTGSTLSFETLSLSWLGKQEITALFFDDGQGSEIRCTQILSEAPLGRLLIGKGNIGTLFVQSPEVKIQLTPPKKIAQAFTAKHSSPQKRPRFSSRFKGHLVLDKGAMQLKDGGEIEISMHQVDLNLSFPLKASSLSLKAQGKTLQGALKGHFDLAVHQGKKSLEGTAAITNFPVAGLEQVVKMFYPTQKHLLLSALGDMLTLQGSITPLAHALQIELSLQTPHLQLDLNGTYQDAVWSCTKGGRIAWMLQPQVLNMWEPLFELKSPTQLELLFQSLSLPLEQGSCQWEALAAQGTLSVQEGSVCLKGSPETIFLHKLESEFETAKLGESLKLSIDSTTHYGTAPKTELQGTFLLTEPLSHPRFSLSELDLHLQNFPMALMDQWKKTDYENSLGSILNTTITTEADHVLVSVSTPLLKISPFKILIHDQIELMTSPSLSYVLTPNLYPALESPAILNGNLSHLSIPLKNHNPQWKDLKIQGTLKTQNVALKDLASLGSVDLPFIDLDIHASSLTQVEFHGTTHLHFSPGTWGLCLLGKKALVRTSGTLKWTDQLDISPFTVRIEGKAFQTQGEGKLEKNILTLKKPLKVHLILDSEQINPLLSSQKLCPLLSRPTPMTWEIQPTSLHLNASFFSSLKLKGTGHIANLALEAPLDGKPLKLETVTIGIDFNNKKNSQLLQCETQVIAEGASSGSIEMEMRSTGPLSQIFQSPRNMHIQLDTVSTQFVDTFFKMDGSLPDMIGPDMNLSYQATSWGDSKDIDLVVNSQDFSLKGAFNTGKNFELKSPLKLQWNISEKGALAFQKWQHPDRIPLSSFEVLGKSSLKVELASLVIPIKENVKSWFPLEGNLFETSFQGQMCLSQLKLQQTSPPSSTELQQFDLEVSKKTLGNSPLSFKFEGHLAPLSDSLQGSLKGEGTVENFLSPQGNLDLHNIRSHIYTHVKNVPSVFLDAFSLNSFPSAFLGNLVNATLGVTIDNNQGDLNLNLNSSACQTTINGNIENGLFSLNQPLHATFTVTPKLNRILEENANLSVVSLKTPFTLKIQNAGFTIPLNNLKTREIHFPKGELDLGKIQCKNTGNPSALNHLFQQPKTDSISFWFAPMQFRMDRGKVLIDRTEVLYNHAYQICLWGDIDLAQHYVNMTLGVTGQALSSALGISNINPNYILRVPVKGTFGHVTIDTGSAAGKIALLLTRKQIAPQKGIWGHVFGAIGDLADDQSNIPPPKTPFPWQITQ